MPGDDCLPVCLVLRSVNNMTLVYTSVALRCVKRQIVNTFSHRQASTLDETLELKKNKLLRRQRQRLQRQRLQRRTNQNRLFSRDSLHCKIIVAPARTFVAMDEEKLRQYALSHPC